MPMPLEWTAARNMNDISDLTRRALLDEFFLSTDQWNRWGNSDEVSFLGRLFDLSALPSTDRRFSNAHDDITQHRVNNEDWPEDWWLSDPRTDLLHAPDETFLRFIAESVHPRVRSDTQHAARLVAIFNRHLGIDGWEIAETSSISGRPIYGPRRLALGVSAPLATAKLVLDADYVRRQIERMEGAMTSDSELAIGTAKEFLETVCRTILRERQLPLPTDDDMPALVKAAIDAVPTVPDGLDGTESTKKTIRVFLNNIASIGRSVAELRNGFGTGHGKDAEHKGLEPRHVRLVVSAATAVGVFLFECHTTRS
jgi:hypothetical protein